MDAMLQGSGSAPKPEYLVLHTEQELNFYDGEAFREFFSNGRTYIITNGPIDSAYDAGVTGILDMGKSTGCGNFQISFYGGEVRIQNYNMMKRTALFRAYEVIFP